MKTELIDIPGLFLGSDARWKVKAISNGESSLVINALEEWKNDPAMVKDYELILQAIEIAAQVERIEDDLIVKPSMNPDHGEVYEFRAYDMERERVRKARLMFFYDDSEEALIICTNSYVKGRGNPNLSQDRMFDRCSQIKRFYERNKS